MFKDGYKKYLSYMSYKIEFIKIIPTMEFIDIQNKNGKKYVKNMRKQKI